MNRKNGPLTILFIVGIVIIFFNAMGYDVIDAFMGVVNTVLRLLGF